MAAFGLAILSQSALAVPGQTQLTTFQAWALVLGGIIITLALMYAAVGMMWQKKPFSEISHVFIGGVIFGSAPIIGAVLVG